MKLKGEYVRHGHFGKGVISKTDDQYIYIDFENIDGIKKFAYPQSVGKFIKFENEKLNHTVKKVSLTADDEKKEKAVVQKVSARTLLRRKKYKLNYSEMHLDAIEISELVKTTLVLLLENDLLEEFEIAWLVDSDYSKDNFDVEYPILMEIDPSSSVEEQQVKDEAIRYYDTVITSKGSDYLLTSEWNDSSKDKYVNWLMKFGFMA